MTDRPDPRRLDLVTDAMVDAVAIGLYEQWVSRDDETRMFAPMWDSLGSRKSGWLQDARIALEAGAPDIAAKAWEEGYQACLNRPRVDGYLINRANPYQTRADRIERGES